MKVNPSTVTFSDASSTIVDPLVTNSPGAGTSTVSGSFGGKHAAAHYVLDQHQADLTALCTGKKGIKKLSFAGASTFKMTLVGP